MGYEQERLTRQKSSSAYPIDAINRILAHTTEPVESIFVSHWFDNYRFYSGDNHLSSGVNKYWNYDHIASIALRSGAKIHTLDGDFTHHDAHAWSAVRFAEEHKFPDGEPVMVFVCDGFGNRQEVFSAYRVENNRMSLAGRIYGYELSMGLMYQYATHFCGMKMHQDEYKFLGYESHINEVQFPWAELEEAATAFADYVVNRGFNTQLPITDDDCPYLDLEALSRTQAKFNEQFEKVLQMAAHTINPSSKPGRIVIGRYIQLVLENFYSAVLAYFENPKRVVVAGGVHFNVKLNNHILKAVDAFSVVPLAGDQGAAIGCWAQQNSGPIYGNLCWGDRDLSAIIDPNDPHVKICNTREEYQKLVADLVAKGEIVNTITGSMEFGPRALCNTSTLALPTSENVDVINTLNGRNTVMPFAPVVCYENITRFFKEDQVKKCYGSQRYMIVTFDYKVAREEYMGVAHRYPGKELYSGRPQVVMPDQPVHNIVQRVAEQGHPPILINTSLNAHGKPIVYSVNDALEDLVFNLKKAEAYNLPAPKLVIGNF